MATNKHIIASRVQSLIYTIRDKQIMLDSDLADLYEVETKQLNRSVKRNIDRFPKEFMFQITQSELDDLRCQIGTSSSIDEKSKDWGGRRYMPYVFTEQGVAMLSAVLKSDIAVKTSVQIMKAFVAMRKFLAASGNIFNRIENIEKRQIEFQVKTDNKFQKVFKAIEEKDISPSTGIFFDGQVFDAYLLLTRIIKSSKLSIVIIDNYIDETILSMLLKRKKGVKATIYTRAINRQMKLDIQKHNEQYSPISVFELKKAHDRFIIIDDETVYHIGASLKDLGKKWFAFSKMEKGGLKILDKLH